MPIVLNGTTGITNDSGYTGDGVRFADSTPANTLVTTSGGNVGIGTSSPGQKLDVDGNIQLRSGNRIGFFDQNYFIRASFGLEVQSADYIRFLTNGANERMRIDSSGNVGIGTSSPTQRLVVSHDQAANSYFDYYNVTNGGGIVWRQIVRNIANTGTTSVDLAKVTGGAFLINNNDTHANNYTAFGVGGSERMRIDSSGTTRFFANNPIFAATSAGANTSSANAIFTGQFSATSTLNGTDCVFITSNGNLYNTNGTYGTISDAKLKENIVDAVSQWDDIKALRVRNFNFKEGQTHTQIGYIAQEVEAVSPSLVDTSPDVDAEGNELGTTTKSLKLSVINIKAVKALQENMARTEALEIFIQELKAINDAQAQTINAQQTALESLTARVVALENQIV